MLMANAVRQRAGAWRKPQSRETAGTVDRVAAADDISKSLERVLLRRRWETACSTAENLLAVEREEIAGSTSPRMMGKIKLFERRSVLNNVGKSGDRREGDHGVCRADLCDPRQGLHVC